MYVEKEILAEIFGVRRVRSEMAEHSVEPRGYKPHEFFKIDGLSVDISEI